MTDKPAANEGVVLLALRAFAYPHPSLSSVANALLELHRVAVPVDTTKLLDLLISRKYVAYDEANELVITPSGRSVLTDLTPATQPDSQHTG